MEKKFFYTKEFQILVLLGERKILANEEPLKLERKTSRLILCHLPVGSVKGSKVLSSALWV